MEQIWSSGKGASCIPEKKNNKGEKAYDHEVHNYYGKDRVRVMKLLQEQKDAHGIRCDFLLKLAVVKAFENV